MSIYITWQYDDSLLPPLYSSFTWCIGIPNIPALERLLTSLMASPWLGSFSRWVISASDKPVCLHTAEGWKGLDMFMPLSLFGEETDYIWRITKKWRVVYALIQIGAANPRLQKVLDALDAIKTKVQKSATDRIKQRFCLVQMFLWRVVFLSTFLPPPYFYFLFPDTCRESRPPLLTLTLRLFFLVLWIIGPMRALWQPHPYWRVSLGLFLRNQ